MSPLEAAFDLNFGAYLHGSTLLVALAGFGFLVGILTGLFGVGGGFIVTPLLNIAFGISYPLAIGSSLSLTIGTSCSAVRRHIRLGNFEPRSAAILAVGSMVGALFGATLNRHLNVSLGEPRYNLIMHSLFVVLLTVTAWLLARKVDQRPDRSLLQRLPLRPCVDLPLAELTGVSLPGLCLAGVTIGLVNGMMGIGGGVLFMPLLVLAIGLSPHRAVGTSLGVVIFSSIAGTIKHGLDGNVNLWLVMSLLVSSVLGVQIGAWICHRLHASKLRRYFAILAMLTALAVAARLLYSLKLGEPI